MEPSVPARVLNDDEARALRLMDRVLDVRKPLQDANDELSIAVLHL